jgi:hypothetical protein
VLYRTANADFHLRYTDSQMRQTYENYLAEVQHTLAERQSAVRKQVAIQEGELESEIQGLRQAPAGFGNRAREEQYELTLLEKESEIELESVREGLAAKDKADLLLASTFPTTLAGVQELENEVRVLARDAGTAANIPMPPPSEPETPLFAVFSNLFDPETIGFEEVFFLLIAVMLDLGDIVGFNLVTRKASMRTASAVPTGSGYRPAEYIPDRLPIKGKALRQLEADYRDDDEWDHEDADYDERRHDDEDDPPEPDLAEEVERKESPRKPRSGRPIRFRRGTG